MTDTTYVSLQTIKEYKDIMSEVDVPDWFNIVFLFVNSFILIATIYVIRKSPTDAVKIGRKLNDAQSKDNAKINLFFTLFSYRGSPVHKNFVDALNRIDIVYYDVPEVLEVWHKYFESLHQKNVVNQEDTWRILRTDLLSKMSLSLGYKDLKQYDIEKHYYPEGHNNQLVSEWEFRNDQQEYYKAAKDLNRLLLDMYQKGTFPIQQAESSEPPGQ